MLKLYYGTKAEYDALSQKESEALYFLTDVRKVMRGNDDFTEAVRFVSTMPAHPIAGVIYIDASAGGAAKAFDGTNIVNVGTPVSTTITSAGTNATTPTTKAAYDSIQDAIATANGYTDDAVSNLENTYAKLSGATFTGAVEAPTPGTSSNNTTVATTAFVQAKIAEIQADIAGALHFEGTVATVADLDNIENPDNGAVYQVEENESEYAYKASTDEWIELGTAIDLSAYYTAAQTDSAISTSAATTQAAAKAYADSLAVNYDSAGSADAAETAAKEYADSLIGSGFDPAGSAAAAQAAAQAYADSLAVNYDPAGSAAAAQAAAEATALAAIQDALNWNPISSS